jgi:hypothetical protein
MLICIVVSTHELVVQIGDVPSVIIDNLVAQIHSAPSAHEPATQSDNFFEEK